MPYSNRDEVGTRIKLVSFDGVLCKTEDERVMRDVVWGACNRASGTEAYLAGTDILPGSWERMEGRARELLGMYYERETYRVQELTETEIQRIEQLNHVLIIVDANVRDLVHKMN